MVFILISSVWSFELGIREILIILSNPRNRCAYVKDKRDIHINYLFYIIKSKELYNFSIFSKEILDREIDG